MAAPGKVESDMIRVRLPDDLKAAWRAVLDGRGISQQKAVVAFVRWIVKQEPLLQVMLFEQVPESDRSDLAKLVLKRLAVGAKGKGGKVARG